jgi:hypothetical protein
MIFHGNLEELAGKCRGNLRSAYADGFKLRADFVRWLGRRAVKNKERNMVLKSMSEKDGMTVMVFEGNDAGKTIERLVAEVILELGRNFQGVPNHALHFASLKHPLSCAQRLREIRAAWKQEWIKRHCHDGMPLTESYIDPIRFVKKENKYYFLVPEFFPWLRKEYVEK